MGFLLKVSPQCKKKRMHTWRMHFFKTLCFTDYNHFSVVRHISLLSFLHYIPMWWIRRRGAVKRTETGRKTKPWSPNITNDKKNCWSQKAEKKDFLKCKNFQSAIGAIWPVKLKEVCGRLAVQNQTHVWKRQTGHGKECRIFQKQWTVSANRQTICCDAEMCVNEWGVFLHVGYNLGLMGGEEAGLWKIFSTNSDLNSFF